jgi:hypothetical protein
VAQASAPRFFAGVAVRFQRFDKEQQRRQNQHDAKQYGKCLGPQRIANLERRDLRGRI